MLTLSGCVFVGVIFLFSLFCFFVSQNTFSREYVYFVLYKFTSEYRYLGKYRSNVYIVQVVPVPVGTVKDGASERRSCGYS